MRQLPRLGRAVQRRVKLARAARFATLDAQHRPHIVPVCFAYHAGVFYTAVDAKPKRVAAERLARVRNILAEPHVALLVDHYDEDWTHLWFVMFRGTARLLPRSARKERERALRHLRAKYPQYARGLLGDNAPIIRVRPRQATCWGKL